MCGRCLGFFFHMHFNSLPPACQCHAAVTDLFLGPDDTYSVSTALLFLNCINTYHLTLIALFLDVWYFLITVQTNFQQTPTNLVLESFRESSVIYNYKIQQLVINRTLREWTRVPPCADVKGGLTASTEWQVLEQTAACYLGNKHYNELCIHNWMVQFKKSLCPLRDFMH